MGPRGRRQRPAASAVLTGTWLSAGVNTGASRRQRLRVAWCPSTHTRPGCSHSRSGAGCSVLPPLVLCGCLTALVFRVGACVSAEGLRGIVSSGRIMQEAVFCWDGLPAGLEAQRLEWGASGALTVWCYYVWEEGRRCAGVPVGPIMLYLVKQAHLTGGRRAEAGLAMSSLLLAGKALFDAAPWQGSCS